MVELDSNHDLAALHVSRYLPPSLAIYTGTIMSTVSTLSMTALSSPLVVSLNKLLAGLSLPFTLETPLDLTPSLLLAILESLLESRLPIPPRVRDSRDQASRVQALKIFLGVLENDVIKQGISSSLLGCAWYLF